MLRSRAGIARAAMLAAAISLVAPMAACAQSPVAGWQPPAAPEVEGVRLLAGTEAGADAEPGSGDPADGVDPDRVGPAPVDGAPADDAPVDGASVDTAALGLVGGRLRNDALPFAARFVYIPGVPAFNAWMDETLWAAIAVTGQPYGPQAHPVGSGLGDRGCVPGSTDWTAAEVLTRPETAPAGGTGTAVTCEVTEAFGHTIAVVLRVVTGAPESIAGDALHRMVVDVESGTVSEAPDRWSDDAALELWQRAVELLRRQAGGLSTAPLAEPDDGQLQLAGQALGSAQRAGDGSFVAELPPGLTSPELEGLGLPPTEQPIRLEIAPETADGWMSEQYRALVAEAGTPFVGLAAEPTSVPIDCDLLPCVALTYDDGPSQFTPELLDTLESRQASVTFYMVGGYAQGNPDPVRRAAAEGHELGSHTMNHPDLTTLPLADARAQVVGAADVLRQITGQPVATFRPPYGAVNAAIIDTVGMPAVLWSVDTNDWRKPGPDALFERAVGGVSPGGIVLFHDTHADTVNAAGDIIDGLRDRGFEPVTVTELFGGDVPLGRVSSR